VLQEVTQVFSQALFLFPEFFQEVMFIDLKHLLFFSETLHLLLCCYWF